MENFNIPDDFLYFIPSFCATNSWVHLAQLENNRHFHIIVVNKTRLLEKKKNRWTRRRHEFFRLFNPVTIFLSHKQDACFMVFYPFPTSRLRYIWFYLACENEKWSTPYMHHAMWIPLLITMRRSCFNCRDPTREIANHSLNILYASLYPSTLVRFIGIVFHRSTTDILHCYDLIC